MLFLGYGQQTMKADLDCNLTENAYLRAPSNEADVSFAFRSCELIYWKQIKILSFYVPSITIFLSGITSSVIATILPSAANVNIPIALVANSKLNESDLFNLISKFLPKHEDFKSVNPKEFLSQESDTSRSLNSCPVFACYRKGALTGHIKYMHENKEWFQCEVCHKSFLIKQNLIQHMNRHEKKYAFKCQLCPREFYTNAEVKFHVLRVHQNVMYDCDICGKPLATKYSLNQHKKTHEVIQKSEQRFTCEVCGKIFPHQRRLNQHLRIHGDDVICHLCGKCLTTKKGLIEHLRVHNNEKPYKCDTCGKSFTKLHSLTVHRRSHLGVKPHRCETCGKSFSQRSPLVIHMRSTDLRFANQCEICLRIFPTKWAVTKHKVIHIGEFSCRICDMKFKKKYLLNYHMDDVHQEKNCYRCEICNKTMSTKQTLRLHLSRHQKKFSFHCQLCQKKYCTYNDVKAHVVRVHENAVYECCICKRPFSSKYAAADHEKTHNSVRRTSGQSERGFKTGSVIGRNQCDVCFKTFFKPSRLRSHKVIHADEKPFTCDLCSASFKRNNALYTHMKKVHQMIYSCEECKIVVSSNLALKIHMNFHTKKFVYECLLCENPFYTKDDAVKHLLDAHEKDEFEPNVAYKCNVCGKYLASGRTLTEHMKEVHPDEYRCKHCNEIFSSNKFLKEHMKSHSNTENGAKKQPGRLNQTKLYKCKFCRKNLDSICTLADHQKTFHPNEVDHSKHECGVCGKLLANKSSLHTHKQSHGDKLICHICGKPLASKLGLTEHLRLHDNVKPYQCEVCGRRFTKLSNLGPHRRTHYQAKIHKCTLCEKAFSQKCTLVIHMRHHSGEKPFKCGLCDSAFISSSLLRNHSKVKHCLF
ncbi:hypothetical protein FQR65_LT10339 [Abscondita terminalis]|nr:hypothetical protein FQR65_LT10339 [Abscondita terminalis]